MCAVQFSPSTYILLLYTHIHIYIYIYIYRIFPGETCAHQCLFFIRPRKFAITFPYTYYHTTRLCTLGIHFVAGFFFYDRFNRKVFTYYYYHRMCTIRIFSCIIILYKSLRSAKSYHQILSYRKSCSCFTYGACSLRVVFSIKIKYIMRFWMLQRTCMI